MDHEPGHAVDGDTPSSDSEYADLVQLEDLESLLEELEDLGVHDKLGDVGLPVETAELALSLNVQSVKDLRQRIVDLHQALDHEEF